MRFFLPYPDIRAVARNGQKILHTCQYKILMGRSPCMWHGKLIPSRGSILFWTNNYIFQKNNSICTLYVFYIFCFSNNEYTCQLHCQCIHGRILSQVHKSTDAFHNKNTTAASIQNHNRLLQYIVHYHTKWHVLQEYLVERC